VSHLWFSKDPNSSFTFSSRVQPYNNPRLHPLHLVYPPTIAPRRRQFRAPTSFGLRSGFGLQWDDDGGWVRVKAVHRNVVCQAMSQRILIRPAQLLTPRLFHQRTVSAFTHQKLQPSTSPHQTRTMSDIKQISSQRAAQRESTMMLWW
jgi:hypothetical protein